MCIRDRLLRKAIDDGIKFVTQGAGTNHALNIIKQIDKWNSRNPGKEVVYLNHSAVTTSLTNELCSFYHFRFDANVDMKVAGLISHMAEDKEINSEETSETKSEEPEVELPVVPLFGKWNLTEVDVEDKTLEHHINLNAFQVPHTGGRHSKKRFGKRNLTVIERIINNLMRSEKYTGKKAQAYSVLKNSFELIHEKKKDNPAQHMVKALENSAQRAEVVSLRYGGIRVYSGVDVSPTRRIDTAIRNLCIGALSSSKKQRSIEKSLAREIMLASEANPDSYAIGKKEEVEPLHPMTYDEAAVGSVNLQPNEDKNVLNDVGTITIPQTPEVSEEECEACNI